MGLFGKMFSKKNKEEVVENVNTEVTGSDLIIAGEVVKEDTFTLTSGETTTTNDNDVVLVQSGVGKVNAARCAVDGNICDSGVSHLVVCAYTIAVTILAVLAFRKNMSSDNR